MDEPHPILTGWLLPLLQAATTGLLTGAAAHALASLFSWQQSPGFAFGLSVAALAWLRYRPGNTVTADDASWPTWQNFFPTQQNTEPAQAQTVRVEVIEEQGRKGQYIDLPATAGQLQRLAAAVLRGASLSEGQWTGAGAPFSRAEYRQLREELIRRGLASWRNPHAPAQGFELTAAGRAVMRRLADLQTTTPPKQTHYLAQ